MGWVQGWLRRLRTKSVTTAAQSTRVDHKPYFTADHGLCCVFHEEHCFRPQETSQARHDHTDDVS
jgi:hypothetical protein